LKIEIERKYIMNTTPLTLQQSQALKEIKQRVMQRFSVIDCLLYGSAARGEADEESDLDLLIVTTDALTRFKRHEITDIIFEVNLKYGTNFSSLVVDQETWETGIISVLPLRDEILKNGVRV
jgi:uncharacterized protein